MLADLYQVREETVVEILVSLGPRKRLETKISTTSIHYPFGLGTRIHFRASGVNFSKQCVRLEKAAHLDKETPAFYFKKRYTSAPAPRVRPEAAANKGNLLITLAKLSKVKDWGPSLRAWSGLG